MPNVIGLQKVAATAAESIAVAGEFLEKAGYTAKSYTAAMIKNFETNGPYFVLAPCFAMPHARPTDGVLKSGISLITLESPVNFGSENDPVKVVLALATGSDEEHIEYMKKIATALSQADIIDRLYNCKTVEEVMNTI